MEWRGIPSTSPSASLTLSVFETGVVAEGTAGALLSLTLNGKRSWKFRVPGQIYLDRLSFEVHTCGRVKDTWCILDVLESVSSIELLCCMVLTSKIAVEYAFDTMLRIVFFQRDMLRGG